MKPSSSLIFVHELLFLLDFEETLILSINYFILEEGRIAVIIGLIVVVFTILAKVTDFLSKLGSAIENLDKIFKVLFFWRKRDSKGKRNENTFGEPEKTFIPNDGVLKELSALICEHPLVCVTGPAGVGKTTVVKQLGHSKSLKKFKKKYRIDLEDVNPPNIKKGENLDYSYEKAKSAFDRGLNLEREANYIDFANGILVPTLIFIDNYEQIIDNDELDQQIRDNLIKPFSQNNQVHIIITSRIYLSYTQRFELKELKNPNAVKDFTKEELVNDYPAIKLFCKIHNELRRKRGKGKVDFSLIDFQMIIDLCNKVSNLPLGIRLIASRSFDKKFIVIKQELKETLKTEIPPPFFNKSNRHKTLFNAFIWSIKLLNQEERNFLNHLTHFKNGFFLKNLPLWTDHKNISQTEDLVEKLHLHSILKEEKYENCTEPKYELYVFAKQLLEISMEENGIALRTDFVYSICSQYSKRLKEISIQIFGETEKSINYLGLVAEVRQDLENIEYFIEWCTEHRRDLAVEILIDIERILNEIGPYLILKKLYDPLLEYYKKGEKRARLLISKARVLKSSEERYLSLSYAKEAINFFESSEIINFNLGEAYKIGAYLSGELSEFVLRENIIEKVKKFSNEQKEALGLTNYAFLILEDAKRYEKLGKIQLAFHSFKESSELYKGYNIQLAKVDNSAGLFCWRNGDPKEAEKYFRSAIKKYKNLGEDRWILGFKTNLGLLYADSGKCKEGLQEVNEAHEVLQQEGPFGWSLINLQSKGRLLTRMSKSNKRFSQAEKILLRNQSELKKLKYHESMILGAVELAELYYKYDKNDKAIKQANFSSKKCLEYNYNNTLRYFRSLLLESLIYQNLGDIENARKKFKLVKELHNNVVDNNWLTYKVCNEKWILLNKIFNKNE